MHLLKAEHRPPFPLSFLFLEVIELVLPQGEEKMQRKEGEEAV